MARYIDSDTLKKHSNQIYTTGQAYPAAGTSHTLPSSPAVPGAGTNLAFCHNNQPMICFFSVK